MTKKSHKQSDDIKITAESFFKDSANLESIAKSQENTEIESTDSLEEQELFFKGDLTNLDDWIKHRESELKYDDRKSERILREKNSNKAFAFTIVWALILVGIIALRGFYTYTCFYIESAEFLFILGTLTVSMFAFYTLVMRYLFYRKDEIDNPS